MALPGITVGSGISVGFGTNIGLAGQYHGLDTGTPAQNVAGSNSNTATFFRPNNSNFGLIVPGWSVDQIPSAYVVQSVSDPNDQYTTTVTIVGGVFTSGSSYSFMGM